MKNLTKFVAFTVRALLIISLAFGYLTLISGGLQGIRYYSFFGIAIVLFGINLFVFRKERKLLPVTISYIAVSLLVSFGLLAIQGVREICAYIIVFIAFLFSMLSLIKWEEKLMSENALRIQFLFATVELMLGIIVKDVVTGENAALSTGENVSGMVITNLIVMILALLNILLFKESGLKEQASGKIALFTGLISALIVGAVGAVSLTINGAMGKLLKMMLYGFSRLFMLISWPIRKLYQYIVSLLTHGEPQGGGGYDPSEYVPPEIKFVEMTDLQKKLWEGGAIALVVVFLLISVIGVIRYIRKKKSIKVSEGRATGISETDAKPKRERRLKKLAESIRLDVKILLHPKSVAFRLRKLERKYRLSPKLKKKEWETAKEFLTNISEAQPKDKENEIKELIERVDFETYSREGNLLRRL